MTGEEPSSSDASRRSSLEPDAPQSPAGQPIVHCSPLTTMTQLTNLADKLTQFPCFYEATPCC